MSHSDAHDHGEPTAVDIEAEAVRGLRGLGAILLVVGALSVSGGAWMLLRTPAPTLAERAAATLDEGHAEEALALAGRALEHEPGSADAWLVQGRVLRALGRLEEARASLERACELATDRWEPRVELGHACLDLGDVTGARAALDAARELAPEEPDVRALERALGG